MLSRVEKATYYYFIISHLTGVGVHGQQNPETEERLINAIRHITIVVANFIF